MLTQADHTPFVSLLISRANLISGLQLEGQTNVLTKLSVCIVSTDTCFPNLLCNLQEQSQSNQTRPLTHPDLLSSSDSGCDWQLCQDLPDMPTGQRHCWQRSMWQERSVPSQAKTNEAGLSPTDSSATGPLGGVWECLGAQKLPG